MYDQTKCVHHPIVSLEGYVSIGVATYRASTIVFDDVQSYADRHTRGPTGYSYGLYGTPTSRTLEAQLTQLHGGVGTVLLPSGQAAITSIMLSVLRPGDRVLIPSSVYPPVMTHCATYLREFGIDHTIYDPLCGSGIEQLIDSRTKLVWVESPGSTSLEVQDLPAIADASHRAGALVGCDNTWASPLLCKPLTLGADFVVEALTKYAGGHSDVLLGSVTVRDEPNDTKLRDWLRTMGIGVSPDDCTLVLRGLETMGVRLAHVGRVAADIARKLGRSTAVQRVLHPALPEHPGNASFVRDFTGASGLFSVELKQQAVPLLPMALEGLKYFKIGASWGGTHSLLAPITLAATQSTRSRCKSRTYLRISIGLEDPDDIWDDLNTIFYRLERQLQNISLPNKDY
ncbi:trans-sulfuration enzyme family protein [Phyllobacterium myrsinacearum]|uniref:Cystathionine beta-lyase n=1 Tax=Phyllobacterium myrsinacearum TaxID=28101 RepID=A0A2S9JGQ2_9HYPH|nr:aminotransferase class I/II-fold pyridoxal phosphate-dependent enzyme [Phyllobacterium myrsinacearum]PRD52168.1 cystathionine beta-lyase [Phyllobacterium myrsinacearum]PWV83787.1 cystathionine beta-lyase [Phyllobacterium myrsinacearum]RZV04693.1 cystathionine beta-lyase [Phyllobacterium myrsinacearum]